MFNEWWAGFSFTTQVFYAIGLFAGLVGLALSVLSLLGFDNDDSIDAPLLGGAAPGLAIFSLKPLTAFFLGFGWAGGTALDAGFSMYAAVPMAFAGGGSLMAVVAILVRAVLGMKSDGTMRIRDAIGAIGTVYVSLPAATQPGGQVIVDFRNRQETFAALTAGQRLAAGAKVKVVSIVDSQTVMVEPLV